MHLSTLSEWLSWIASLHQSEIDLGLDRVKQVAARLNLLSPRCPVIIVGGTNGKGSTVAALESIYRAAGYRTGAFTSPILFKHNEQVRINGSEASDEEFCSAFARIEAVRLDVSLTPFEFFTLAALSIFHEYALDVMILEVGLGGRLDAVNILDADVAIVTSIAMDHTDWLGPTREAIGFEKAGIFRSNHPAVCGDLDPPQSLIDHAIRLKAPLYCQGKAFHYEKQESTWSWHDQDTRYDQLPLNTLSLQNMSTALMGMTLLQDRLPVDRQAIDTGLVRIQILGRVQVIEGPVITIFDVSHNPAAILHLANQLKQIPCDGKTYAVFSMLTDKDIMESVKSIYDKIHAWYVAPLKTKRAATKEQLSDVFKRLDIHPVNLLPTIEEAYDCAIKQAKIGDRVVIFGSFHTVADVWIHVNK